MKDFEIGDVIYVKSNPETKMNLAGFTKREEVIVLYIKHGLIRALSNFLTEIIVLYKK
ncbi:hypothetical protein HZP25_15630 [Elizabethkingia anophelis]|nr:hypothetical protein [Elizabethkingia anophelis]